MVRVLKQQARGKRIRPTSRAAAGSLVGWAARSREILREGSEEKEGSCVSTWRLTITQARPCAWAMLRLGTAQRGVKLRETGRHADGGGPRLLVRRRGAKGAILTDMSALKARVENGRLVLDEPTDLPEGTVVPLQIADDWDDLEDAERAELHEALREAFEDAKAGRTIAAEQWAAALRSRL